MDIQELKLTLSDLNERLNDIKINVYKIDSKKTRLQEIESQLSQEKVWSNLELSQKLSKEKTAIEKTISSYNNVSARLSDCQVLLDVSVEENDDSSFQEIFDETLKLNDLNQLHFTLMVIMLTVG
jgi:peptide chain release factor 2